MSASPRWPETPAQREESGRRASRWLRLPPLILAVATLVVATAAGLQRMGWEQLVSSDIAALHGPLMVCGVFGTLIALERAVALGACWAYAGPIAAALGSVAFLCATPYFGAGAWIVAGVALTAASVVAMRRHPASFTAVLALGAGCWLAGSIALAAGYGIEGAVPWWMAFLILTIAAERLELSRFLPPRPAQAHVFAAIVLILLGGVLAAAAGVDPGWRLTGAAMLALSIWLMRNDIARRTIRQRGLPRYAAICLSGGYAWLIIAGAILLSFAVQADRLAYDAALHAVFLGFVFAMVFGHAPIIVPAVTGLSVPFSRFFYVPLALLHGSVAIRVGADLAGWLELRRISGALSAIALALFAVSMLAAVCRSRWVRSRGGARTARKGGIACP